MTHFYLLNKKKKSEEKSSDHDYCLPIFNFSNEELTVTLDSKYFQGNYTELLVKKNSCKKIKMKNFKNSILLLFIPFLCFAHGEEALYFY